MPNPFCSINVRKYRRGNQNFTIQRNWQQMVHRTTKNKPKTQHNMCWAPLCASKHKEREYDMNMNVNTPTYNWRKRRSEHRLYADIVTDITTRNSERKDT